MNIRFDRRLAFLSFTPSSFLMFCRWNSIVLVEIPPITLRLESENLKICYAKISQIISKPESLQNYAVYILFLVKNDGPEYTSE